MEQKEIEPINSQTEESIETGIFIKESNSSQRKPSKIVIKLVSKTE